MLTGSAVLKQTSPRCVQRPDRRVDDSSLLDWHQSWELIIHTCVGSVSLGPRYTFFERHLRPMEHYVPFWRDNESDILQAMQWLRNHDSEAQAMVCTHGCLLDMESAIIMIFLL